MLVLELLADMLIDVPVLLVKVLVAEMLVVLVPVKEMLEVPVPVLLADVLEVELAVVLVMVLTWRAFAAIVTGRPTDAWRVDLVMSV